MTSDETQTFGRICPGRHFAFNSAWIAIASILSTYNVSKSVDQNGNLVEIPFEYTDGLVMYVIFMADFPLLTHSWVQSSQTVQA